MGQWWNFELQARVLEITWFCWVLRIVLVQVILLGQDVLVSASRDRTCNIHQFHKSLKTKKYERKSYLWERLVSGEQVLVISDNKTKCWDNLSRFVFVSLTFQSTCIFSTFCSIFLHSRIANPICVLLHRTASIAPRCSRHHAGFYQLLMVPN